MSREYLREALHVLRECAHAPPSEVLQQLQDGRVHRVVRGHRPEEIWVLLLVRKNRRGGGEGKLRKRERTLLLGLCTQSFLAAISHLGQDVSFNCVHGVNLCIGAGA